MILTTRIRMVAIPSVRVSPASYVSYPSVSSPPANLARRQGKSVWYRLALSYTFIYSHGPTCW